MKVSGFEIHGKFQESRPICEFNPLYVADVRFPTSLTGDGSDAMYLHQFHKICLEILMEIHRNTDCDYSSAYVTLLTDSDLVGHGMTFTIGRGNDIV